MQCAEFENRLNRLLDSRLSPDEDSQLADHAHECEGCSSLLHAQHVLFSGLRASRPTAPADLADRVVSRRYTEVSRSRTHWQNIGWAMLLATAAGLLGLIVMTFGRGQSEIVKTPEPAPDKRIAPVPGIAMTNVGPANQVEPNVEELDEVIDVLGKEFDEVSKSIEPSVKPIRSSFGLAIDALWRTIPRGRERPNKPDSGASFLPELPSVS